MRSLAGRNVSVASFLRSSQAIAGKCRQRSPSSLKTGIVSAFIGQAPGVSSYSPTRSVRVRAISRPATPSIRKKYQLAWRFLPLWSDCPWTEHLNRPGPSVSILPSDPPSKFELKRISESARAGPDATRRSTAAPKGEFPWTHAGSPEVLPHGFRGLAASRGSGSPGWPSSDPLVRGITSAGGLVLAGSSRVPNGEVSSMSASSSMGRVLGLAASLAMVAVVGTADEPGGLPRACIDGTGPGWRALGEDDFTSVNCDPETWSWKDGVVHCTGTPVGVTRTKQPVKNFELVAQWRHLKSGGNSGIFVWAPEKALTGLKPNSLPPGGIEVQVLDHGYAEKYEKDKGKKPDWFTTHGDVFPVGSSRMKPFPPVSPDGSRSFPSKHLSKGIGEWNHYYVRGINGEIRLWVNGEEVSGGSGCDPASGLPLPRIRRLARGVQEPADPGTPLSSAPSGVSGPRASLERCPPSGGATRAAVTAV